MAVDGGGDGCGDGSQGGTMGLVETAGCRCGAAVNLRAQRCGDRYPGDAAGVTHPAGTACKEVLLLLANTVWEECWLSQSWECWSLYLRTPLHSEKLPENLICPQRPGRGPDRVAAAPRSATPSHGT